MTTVEKHAEAASRDLWKRLVDESLPFNRLTRGEKTAVINTIVAGHMQAAVDEEVALLRGVVANLRERIAELLDREAGQ